MFSLLTRFFTWVFGDIDGFYGIKSVCLEYKSFLCKLLMLRVMGLVFG